MDLVVISQNANYSNGGTWVFTVVLLQAFFLIKIFHIKMWI
jgi:hypothetical protein